MTEGATPKPGLAFWRSVQKIDKSKINNGWMALRNSLAVAVPLGVGIALGNPLGAVAVATGALNVSFSDGRDPYSQRARRMLLWSFLGAFAAFIGCATGGNNAAAILIAAAWSFAAGLLIALGTRAGDLGLNTLVALVVFAGRGPMSLPSAINTGLLVLAGGFLQSAFCLAFWPVRRYDPERRAIGHVFLRLAGEVDPDSEQTPALPDSPRGSEEEDTIAALGDDHTLQGERFRLLFDQADRLRLSIYLIYRLRDELGEEHQKSEVEGDAADLLHRILRLASDMIRAAGDGLLTTPSNEHIAALQERLNASATEMRALGQAGGFPLAPSVGPAVDVVAGQLRLVTQLVENADQGEWTEAVDRPNAPTLQAQFLSGGATLRANLDLRSAICRHAIRLGVCLTAGDWLERGLGWHRAYWLPMTIAVVLKPDFATTFSRGVLRLFGTFAGLILATALYHFLPHTAITALLLVGAFTFLLRYWGPANYGIFTFAISGLVVFLIAATGGSPSEAIPARALNTAVGGFLALFAYVLWPTWESSQVQESFAEMIDASRAYLRGVLDSWTGAPVSDLDDRRLEWRRTRSNVEASVDRVAQEPGITALRRDTLLSMLASSRALIYAIMGLEAGLAHKATAPPSEALRRFGNDVDFTLYALAAALRGSEAAGRTLPELREDHRRLIEARDRFSPDDRFILIETDRLTVSLNTLREQVMRYVEK